MHNVALNAAHTIALAKLQGNLEISKCAAVELALNQGLFDLGVLSEEDYQYFDARYRRKLRDIITENQIKRENSHLPKLELEKQKRNQIQASAQKEREKADIAKVEASLQGMWKQWDLHTDLTWKLKTIAYAKKFSDRKYAKLLIAKEKECDTLSPAVENQTPCDILSQAKEAS